MTPQRQLVLHAVGELGHATPEQICRRVQCSVPSVNITTVYRTLDLLEELGVVQHTHLGHGAPRYSTRPQEYLRLACHRCEHVIEVDAAELGGLSESLRIRFGFELDPTHVALSGLCAACARDE